MKNKTKHKSNIYFSIEKIDEIKRKEKILTLSSLFRNKLRSCKARLKRLEKLVIATTKCFSHFTSVYIVLLLLANADNNDKLIIMKIIKGKDNNNHNTAATFTTNDNGNDNCNIDNDYNGIHNNDYNNSKSNDDNSNDPQSHNIENNDDLEKISEKLKILLQVIYIN